MLKTLKCAFAFQTSSIKTYLFRQQSKFISSVFHNFPGFLYLVSSYLVSFLVQNDLIILTLYSSRFKTELVPSWTGLCLPSCFQFGIYVMYLSSFINEGVTVLISPQKFKICQRPQNSYCPEPIGLEFRVKRALKF